MIGITLSSAYAVDTFTCNSPETACTVTFANTIIPEPEIINNTSSNFIEQFDYNSLNIDERWRFFALGGVNRGVSNYEINCDEMSFNADCDMTINSMPGFASHYIFEHDGKISNIITSWSNGDLTFAKRANGNTVTLGGYNNSTGYMFVQSAKIEIKSPNGSFWRCGPSDTGVWSCVKI